MLKSFLFSVGMALCVGVTAVSANVITSFSPQVGPGGSFSAPTITSTGSGTSLVQNVSFNIDVQKLHLPIDAIVVTTGAPNTTVNFSLTLTNSSGKWIGPSDFQFVRISPSTGAAPALFLNQFSAPSAPNPNSNKYTVHQVSSDRMRLWFGGTLGGGGGIAAGGTATFNFSTRFQGISSGTRRFFFRFTANPEPTSMALAGLGIGLVGVGGWLRRRKKAVKAAE